MTALINCLQYGMLTNFLMQKLNSGVQEEREPVSSVWSQFMNKDELKQRAARLTSGPTYFFGFHTCN